MTATDANATNMPSVNPVGMPLSMGFERICESPLCGIRFPPAGMAISPKRFCSEPCKMNAWIIRKAAALLIPLGKEAAWQILEGQGQQ
jgi:hypothetical protein